MDELFAFDGSLWVHRTRGAMTAQCDLEAHNNIALNLGHEVAMGRRTVADARAMYVKLAMEHKEGMASPYTFRHHVPDDAERGRPRHGREDA